MPTYDYPLYRPPSEADSLIFQVTLGCSFNVCSFCNMYRTKEYIERPWDEIKMEIDLAAKHIPDSKRIFLADGDALNLSTERMLQILGYIYQKFPKLERVSCYAMPKNLLEKTSEDLKKLYDAGLKMFYVGIESGSDIVLKKVTKGATSQTIIKACQKAKDTGYLLSCMIILGLGGKTYTKEHADDTAKVVSAVSPDYLAALTLYLEDGVRDEFMTKFKEPFVPVDDVDVLDELEILVNKIDSRKPIVFRSNHASNAYTLGGILPAEKKRLLQEVSALKTHPEFCRPKEARGF